MTTAAVATAPIQFGRVVGNTFGALRQNIGTYLILAVVFSGLPSLVIDTLFARMAAASSDRFESFRLGYIQSGIENIFAYPLIAAVILGVVAHLRGQKLSLNELWTQGLAAWGSLFALGFIKGLGVGIGTLLLVVPGVIWAVMWAVALPVKMIEKRPVAACLDRSSVLTKGRRWPIAGLILLYVIGIGAVGVLLGLIAGLLIGILRTAGTPWAVAVQQFVSALVSMATDLVGAAGTACLYFELKTTKEGDEATTVAAVFA